MRFVPRTAKCVQSALFLFPPSFHEVTEEKCYKQIDRGYAGGGGVFCCGNVVSLREKTPSLPSPPHPRKGGGGGREGLQLLKRVPPKSNFLQSISILPVFFFGAYHFL